MEKKNGRTLAAPRNCYMEANAVGGYPYGLDLAWHGMAYSAGSTEQDVCFGAHFIPGILGPPLTLYRKCRGFERG